MEQMNEINQILEYDADTSMETEDVEGRTLDNNTSTPISVFAATCDYQKLIDHYSKIVQLGIMAEDKKLEGMSYLSLGCAYYALDQFKEAITFFEKAAKLCNETENRKLEIRCYTNLAVALETVERPDDSHLSKVKALNLSRTNEDTEQSCEFHSKQGIIYHDSGEYEKSIMCHERSLEISQMLCDRQAEGTSYYNLGVVYCTTGQYKKSIECHKQCLEIRREMNDRHGEAISCTQLAYLCYFLGNFKKSIKYQERALVISIENSVSEMEATCWQNLGCVYRALGDYDKSNEYCQKRIHIRKTLKNNQKEKVTYGHLSDLSHAFGLRGRATERAFAVDEGRHAKEFTCSSSSGRREERFEIMEVMEGSEDERFFIPRTVPSHTSKTNVTKTTEYLSESIKSHEDLRLDLNDECKLSLDDQSVFLYKTRSLLFISFNNSNAALFAMEQGRARALVDLMLDKYSTQGVSDINLERIHSSAVSKIFTTQKSNFLFMAFLMNNLVLWFVDTLGKLSFQQYSEPDPLIKSTEDLLEQLRTEMNETLKCEDEDNAEVSTRPSEEEENKRDACLRGLYKAIIDPVKALIEGPEIIIVPEGQMFLIPFPALRDKNGRCLSETVRIRLVPSLTALKLIQDAPAEYHCETGALIVGDPTNGLHGFRPLPNAKKEVEMIATMLGVPYLVGKQATKNEVLHRIQEVSLVHIAAHGDPERGEIALAPSHSDVENLHLEDFVLTVEDVAAVNVRAKLVVLSTCYSAGGKVMAGEGVVGIARAFLGAGARSVVMTLWDVRDEAAEAFMYGFYRCLVCEQMSASEALHCSMKEMRSKWGYTDEQDWASFVLLGDDVKIDFL